MKSMTMVLGGALLGLSGLAGCAVGSEDDLGAVGSRISCSTDDDCSSGECQVEDTGSFCKPLACDTNADCPAGEECELEHGVTFCKPHGGDDASGATGSGSSSSSSSSSATGGGAGECATDADCPAGLECELEHGTSYCKEHGGK